MKVTEKPVTPESEKVLEISEKEFTKLAKEAILEETRDAMKIGPRFSLLISLAFAGLMGNLHRKLFSQEEAHGDTE